MRNAIIGIIVAAAVVTCCGSSSVAPSQTDWTRPTATPAGGRVLFIGNSLTQANGFPTMVETLSREGGATPSTANVVVGGHGLEDQLKEGTARRRVAEGGWSVDVLQQGPSSLPESQVALREWTKRLHQQWDTLPPTPSAHASLPIPAALDTLVLELLTKDRDASARPHPSSSRCGDLGDAPVRDPPGTAVDRARAREWWAEHAAHALKA